MSNLSGFNKSDSGANAIMCRGNLGDVAPEIIIGVFESLSSIQDILSLSRTSRRLYSIWTGHSHIIVSKFVHDTIECVEQVDALAKSQRFDYIQPPTNQCSSHQTTIDYLTKVLRIE